MSNDFASIDIKVGNAARITKLYGTVSKKVQTQLKDHTVKARL